MKYKSDETYHSRAWCFSTHNQFYQPNGFSSYVSKGKLGNLMKDLKYEIDILLDSHKKELKLCIINNYDQSIKDEKKKTECRYWNLPIGGDNNKGFVPYINMGSTSKGCRLRIAKVPQSWYAEHEENIFD